eukprot:1259803-Prymnesium_polylepis.1
MAGAAQSRRVQPDGAQARHDREQAHKPTKQFALFGGPPPLFWSHVPTACLACVLVPSVCMLGNHVPTVPRRAPPRICAGGPSAPSGGRKECHKYTQNQHSLPVAAAVVNDRVEGRRGLER